MYLFILLRITSNCTQWTWEPKRCCETCRLQKTKDRILWLIWNPALFSGCHGAMTISSNYLGERSILEWTKNRGSISFFRLGSIFKQTRRLASQIKTEEETWIMGYWSPISDTQVRIHSAQQDSPVSKIIFTLFSLFFGGPSLSITD